MFHSVTGELPDNARVDVQLARDRKPKKGGRDLGGRKRKGMMIKATFSIANVSYEILKLLFTIFDIYVTIECNMVELVAVSGSTFNL